MNKEVLFDEEALEWSFRQLVMLDHKGSKREGSEISWLLPVVEVRNGGCFG
jgi:hypothetical protein